MLEALFASVRTAAVERATLFANHVIAAERPAVERLRPHAGRCIGLRFDAWPALLPALPELTFRVTPAGLLEWCGSAPESIGAADLGVRIDAANPAALAARWAAGERPRIDIQGDAQFATDVGWLIDHLRWDAEDDLARWIGPAPARAVGRAVARVSDLVHGTARQAARWTGTGDAGPGAR